MRRALTEAELGTADDIRWTLAPPNVPAPAECDDLLMMALLDAESYRRLAQRAIRDSQELWRLYEMTTGRQFYRDTKDLVVERRSDW